MKALTIKEPCASAIGLGIKHYETRSWSTKYRGPLLIHAGRQDWDVPRAWVTAEQLGINPRYGQLICKANLVDCIKIDREFMMNLYSQDNRTEFNLGFFEPDRYAWVLEDIEPINDTTIVRGYQGLWNFKEEI